MSYQHPYGAGILNGQHSQPLMMGNGMQQPAFPPQVPGAPLGGHNQRFPHQQGHGGGRSQRGNGGDQRGNGGNGNGGGDNGVSRALIAQLSNTASILEAEALAKQQERYAAQMQQAKEEEARVKREEQECRDKQFALIRESVEQSSAKQSEMFCETIKKFESVVTCMSTTVASTSVQHQSQSKRKASKLATAAASSVCAADDGDSDDDDSDDDADWVALAAAQSAPAPKKAKVAAPAPVNPGPRVDGYKDEFMTNKDFKFLNTDLNKNFVKVANGLCAAPLPKDFSDSMTTIAELCSAIAKHKAAGGRGHWFNQHRILAGEACDNKLTRNHIVAKCLMKALRK